MSIIVTPISGSPVTYADTGDYDSEGQWLEGGEDSVRISGRKYSLDFPSAGGVDGSGSKNFGFRSQTVEFLAIYVGASETALMTTITGHLDNWPNQPSTVAVGGYSIKRAFLDPEGTVIGKIKDNGLPTQKFFTRVKLRFTGRGL